MPESSDMPKVRTGQATFPISREDFERRFRARFADPNYELSVDWLATRDAIREVQKSHDDDPAARPLMIQITKRRQGKLAPDERLRDPRPK